MVTCWERADLLALDRGVYCEFVTFPLVLDCIDLCTLTYLVNMFSIPVNSHESDTVRYKYDVSAVPASFLGDDAFFCVRRTLLMLK